MSPARMVTVQIELLPGQVEQLAQAAKFRRTTVERLIALTVRDFINPRSAGQTPGRMSTWSKERLVSLHADGLNDPEIAAVIGVVPETVRRYRAKHGLLTNETRGRGPKTHLTEPSTTNTEENHHV